MTDCTTPLNAFPAAAGQFLEPTQKLQRFLTSRKCTTCTNVACVLVTSAEKMDFWTVQLVLSFPETVLTSNNDLNLCEALLFLKTNLYSFLTNFRKFVYSSSKQCVSEKFSNHGKKIKKIMTSGFVVCCRVSKTLTIFFTLSTLFFTAEM